MHTRRNHKRKIKKKKYLGVSENIDQNLLDTIKNKICKGEVRSQTTTMEA